LKQPKKQKADLYRKLQVFSKRSNSMLMPCGTPIPSFSGFLLTVIHCLYLEKLQHSQAETTKYSPFILAGTTAICCSGAGLARLKQENENSS